MRIQVADRLQAAPTPLRLRAVTAETAAAARLRAQVFHADIACGAQAARLSLRSCVAPASPGWGMTLDTRAGNLLWCASATVWQSLSGIDPGAGPEPSRLALCQAVLALLPQRLRALLGEPVVRALWQTLPPPAPASSATVWQQLDCRLDEVMLTSHLSATAQCWHTLLAPPWRAQPALPWARLAAVPLRLPLVLGELQLSPAQARTLGRGDVLRLALCRFDSDGSGWIDLPACRLAIGWMEQRNAFIFYQWESRTIMQPDYETDAADHARTDDETDYRGDEADLERDPQDEENDAAYDGADHATDVEYQDAAEDDAADYDATGSFAAAAQTIPGLSKIPPATLEQLPLRLKVVLGEFELTLQALRTLAPGAVLELSQGLPPQVTLEAHGRCLGQGELVTLDGALAVQLSSWLDAAPEPLR